MDGPDLPNLTLPQMLRHNARTIPERMALRQKEFGIWKPFSWGRYWERARHFGLGLQALGLGPGGHLGVLSENRIEWVLAQLGAGAVDAVTVGVYPTSPAPEVAYVLGHAEVEVLVAEDQEQVDKAIESLPELPRLRRIVACETKGLRGYDPALVISFAEVERMGAELDAREPERVDAILDRQSLGQTGLIVYTSGSTGKPKGAMITYANIRAEAEAIVERLGFDAGTTHLSYLPLCHVAEQMLTTMGPIYVGSLVNFGESIRTVQEDLREVSPDSFLGVPRIWEKMHSAISIKVLEAGGWRKALFDRAIAGCEPFADLPAGRRTPSQRLTRAFWHWLVFRALLNFIGLRRLRIGMTGAAPISPLVVRFFRTIGVPLVEVYGQTETTGMVTGQRLESFRPGTVGEIIRGTEFRTGPEGELLVRGPTVFAGYYKSEAATRAAFEDGWLRTGDVVEVGEDGQIRILDRLKDIMITSGGKNLSPSEIENAMKASVFIKECIVVGEGRKYVAALVQVDFETVGKWAEENGIPYTHFRSLAGNPAVRALIGREIEAANRHLAPVAQVRRFHLLTKELDHDDDEVTATMKVRRSNIYRKYQAEIAALYDREASAAAE